MLPIAGALTVIICVLGGFAAMGGNVGVLWQPFEIAIVVGAAVGAFLIGNPVRVVREVGASLRLILNGPRHEREDYLDLLALLYTLLRTAKTKGLLALEQHFEHPQTSTLFAEHPHFHATPRAVDFLCDYLRLLSLGTTDPEELEHLMDAELETVREEQEQVIGAMQTTADAMPALGIVAAVLGVIKTMGAINAPPEVLGGLIGGALVGTFLGVFLAYGFLGPMASALRAAYDAETRYLRCIQAAIVAHASGYAPAVATEFARKALISDVRPSFQELEDATARLQPV